MSERKIYIFHDTATDINRLTELYGSEGYEVEKRQVIPSEDESIPDENVVLFLIDYDVIVQAERTNVIRFFQQISRRNIVVYNVPENANRRMAFYELGARRVFERSGAPEEIFYATRWVLKSVSTEDEKDALYSRGRLEDIPLAKLISSLGKEKRTGVLKLVTSASSGKIYFYTGNIDDAWVNGHTGEEAVLHMLYWNKGDFFFTASETVKPKNNIALSNIGLVLLAEKRRKSFLENLKKIGTLNSTLRVIHLGDVRALHPEIEESFLHLIKKPLLLEEALDNPVYTCYETAEKLVVLKEEELLQVKQPHRSVFEAVPEAIPSAQAALNELILNQFEIQQLKVNLHIEGENTGKIVVLGSRLSGKSDFIQHLTGAKNQAPEAKDLEVARVTLSTDLDLLLFGMTVDQMVMETTEKLSEGLVGYIFLISYLEQDTYEYVNYVINHLLSMYPVSCVAAVTEMPSPDLIDSVRSKFNTQFIFNWVPCNPADIRSIHDVLLAMEPVTLPAKKEDGENEAAEEETEEPIQEKIEPDNPAIETQSEENSEEALTE